MEPGLPKGPCVSRPGLSPSWEGMGPTWTSGVHVGKSSSLCSRNVSDRLKVTEPRKGPAVRLQLSRKAADTKVTHTQPQTRTFLSAVTCDGGGVSALGQEEGLGCYPSHPGRRVTRRGLNREGQRTALRTPRCPSSAPPPPAGAGAGASAGRRGEKCFLAGTSAPPAESVSPGPE